MKTKRCPKCKKIKPINEFYKNKSTKNGYHCQCKDCMLAYSLEYAKNNREKIKNKAKKWYKNNVEYCKKHNKKWRKDNLEYLRQWRKDNPEKDREYAKERRLNNTEREREINRKWRSIPKNRLNNNISRLIRTSLKGNKKGNHWEDLVGYALQDLMSHLERQFKDGMNWNNYGKWHVDHKIPVSFFEFSSYNDWEFKYCWSLNNLQPLWAEENLRKWNKII